MAKRKRIKQKKETSLYVKCPQCRGTGEIVYGLEESQAPCSCQNGFIETGFTQERFDALVTRCDRLLIAVDDALDLLGLGILSQESRNAAIVVLKHVAGTAEEVETARSHFRTDS